MSDLTDRIRDSIPEDFWRVATWRDDGDWIPGALDIADRQRIIRHVTACALLLVADEMDVKQMGAKVDRANAAATTDAFFNYGKQRAWGEARILLRSTALLAVNGDGHTHAHTGGETDNTTDRT